MRMLTKYMIYLMSILLVFTSLPWNVMVQAEGTVEAYEERLGLDEPPNGLSIPAEDPEAEMAGTTFTEGAEPVYPEEGEIVEERTATSKVFSNGDGTFTEEIYPEPIHSEEAPGKWEDISTDLVEDPQADAITGEQTEIDVEFPTEVEESYVTFQTEEPEQQLEYELIEAEGPTAVEAALAPTIEYNENQIFHRSIFPGVDLRSILFDTSLKEDIILKEPGSYHTFRFQVRTALEGHLLENGSIEWKDGEDVVFQTPAPVMADSNVDERSGESARSTDLAFALEPNEQGYLLTLSADPEWLDASERKYPVYIDPTTSLPTAADSFVSSAWPDANYDAYWDPNHTYYNLRAGYYDSSTGTQYSYIKQNVSHLEGATIDSATFNLYTAHSYYVDTPTGVWIDTVNANWSASTVTWNNKPSSTYADDTTVYRGQWAKFDVKAAVQNWVDGTKPNYGFKVHNNGNGQTYWKRFYASENSTNKPYLSVTYSYPNPTAPEVSATNYNNGTDTGYLDVSWPSVSGASGYTVYVYNGKEYDAFPVGNVTSWSTKGKKIWPTDEHLYNGEYRLRTAGDGQELPVKPSETYKTSGGAYSGYTKYWVKVAAHYGTAGSSDMSLPYMPYMPLSKPAGVKGAASINLDNSSGYISASWQPVELATGYKVLLFNGKAYEEVADIPVDPLKPDHALKWSSQGKKLWPTAADAAAGRYALRLDGTGTELPKDPRPVYTAAKFGYENNLNYYVRVKAYSTLHPISVQSDAFRPTLPDKQEPLGEEEYWPILDTPAGSVNSINGNLTFSKTDESFSGRGPSVELARTYNSLSTQIGSFGRGWLFTYDMKLEEQSNLDVRLTEEDGTTHLFKYVSAGNYTPPHDLFLSLEKVAGGFILTTKKRDKLHFTGSRLTKIEDGDRKENTVLLDWTTTGLVITDASGRVINLTLANNKITQVKDYSGRTWSYSYTGDDLTSYTDSKGSTFRYGYSNGQLTSVWDAYGEEMTLGYDTSKRLISVTDTIGRVTTLSYGTNKASITHPATETSNGTVSSTDTLTYNAAGNPATLVTDEGTGRLNIKTTYTYETQKLVKTIDSQTGTKTISYDANGNALNGVNANLGEVSASYDLNNKAASITDALKKKYTNAYDGNLMVSSSNPTKTSSSAQYDNFGNMSSSAKKTSVAFNYLTNGGYEENATAYSPWTIRTGGGDLGTAALTTSAAKQERTITLTPDPSSTLPAGSLSYVALTQLVDVKENMQYTLSGLVKTDKLGGRAFLNVFMSGTDSAGNPVGKWLDNRSHSLTGTNTEWTEQQLSFTTPAGTKQVRIYLEVDNGSKGLTGGTATFDNVQLEDGQVSASYNPVLNSGFEESEGAFKTSFSGWGNSTGTLKGQVDPFNPYDGKASVKVLRKNSADPAFTMTQTIQLNQTTPIPVTASALSKALEVAGNPTTGANEGYNLYLRAYNAAGTQIASSQAKFALGSHDWQKVTTSVKPTEAIEKVTLYLSFNGSTTGTAWFDSVRLQDGLIASAKKYDAKGNNLLSETDELGYTQAYEYDSVGNLIKATDAKGNMTNYAYNEMNELETTSLPGSDAEVHYTYDRHGLVTEKAVRSKTDASVLFGSTSYLYDDADQLLKQSVNTANRTYDTRFTYNARGAVKLTTYPTGSRVSTQYDSADRPIGLVHTLPGGAAEQVATFKLDSNGNQIEVHNLLTNTKQFQSFDKGNRVTRQSNGTSLTVGPAVDWKFDANDNITEETISNGAVSYKHQFKYNLHDNNTELIDPSEGRYRFQYDETGNVKSYSGPNGTGSLFTYDERDFVKSINIGHTTNPRLIKFGYKYDANGNRTEQSVLQQFASRETLNGTALFTYDAMEQLTSETVPLNGEKLEYKYDVLGNRTKKTVTKNGISTQVVDHVFNERNQLVQVKDGSSTTQWTYDDNGNLLEDGKFSYKWDADNRLRKVTDKATGDLVAEYWYDEADRRIRKNVDGVLTNYIYDGDGLNVLYETNASNGITAYHSFNTNGQLMARTEVSGTTSSRYYYHYNAHGDVVMVTKDNETAKEDLIVASYVYDSWGNIVHQEGPYAEKNPYRYAGYQFDAETDLYYLMSRFYNSESGVFISMDPDPGDADDILTQNGYTYASNNPVMLVDPDGHAVWLVINAGLAAYEGYKAYQAGKKAGKNGMALAASVAWASGNGFAKFGHIKKAGKIVGATSSKFINGTRGTGVNRAWKEEREMIAKTGQGTRKWSGKRRQEILEEGKAEGIVGHHVNSVGDYPELAGLAKNVRFLTPPQHKAIHGGNWRNQTTGKFIERQ